MVLLAKYISKSSSDEDAAITGFTKCYTINTMLMKSEGSFRDNVETTLASVVFWIR
jgi:hypothetical protein